MTSPASIFGYTPNKWPYSSFELADEIQVIGRLTSEERDQIMDELFGSTLYCSARAEELYDLAHERLIERYSQDLIED